MLVSLSDVLTSEGKVETVAILEMTSFKSQGDFSIMEDTHSSYFYQHPGVNKGKSNRRCRAYLLIRNVTGALLKYLQQ